MAQTSQSERFKYLEPAALQQLGNLRFAARRIVEGSYAGRHRSRMRGSSVEFAEYHEYSPGDDLRRVDWKVYMRTRKPFVRTYDEETNMNCILMLDTSRSMDFGKAKTPKHRLRGAELTKLDYCRYLAAALAYLIIDGRDQAGLALAGEKLETWLPPGSTSTHLNEMLNLLERATPQPKTNLASALKTLYTLTRRRGLITIVSDFLDSNLDHLFQSLRLFRHRRFEIVLFHVVHPNELRLPEGRSIRFFDPESDAEIEADPQDIEAGYLNGFDAFRARVRNMAIGSGCEYEMIDTSTPYPQALRAYLKAREGMGAR